MAQVQHRVEDSSSDEETGCCAVDSDEEQHGTTRAAYLDDDTGGNAALSGSKKIHDQPSYIRRDFVRKVYTILCIQLVLTTAIAYPFSNENLIPRSFMESGAGAALLYTAMGLLIVLVCCCQSAMRTYPSNYAVLFAITALMSVLVGVVTSRYETNSVILAAGLTAGIFLSLTCYACCTKSDFTGMGPYLFAALSCMICFSFMMSMSSLLFGGSLFDHEAVRKGYAGIGALLFSMYIVYDTQLIVGGKHKKHQFDIDDYCFAALNLYLDIINLFLYLLELFGKRN